MVTLQLSPLIRLKLKKNNLCWLLSILDCPLPLPMSYVPLRTHILFPWPPLHAPLDSVGARQTSNGSGLHVYFLFRLGIVLVTEHILSLSRSALHFDLNIVLCTSYLLQ